MKLVLFRMAETARFAGAAVVMLLPILVLTVACGGGGGEETTPAASATATETPSAGESPEVAAYPEAEEVVSGTYVGRLPITLPDPPLDPKEYPSVSYAVYNTDDSADKVFKFYKNELKEWNEEGTFDIEQEGVKGHWGVWSQSDAQVAAWIWVGESEGTTTALVATGSR
jgi:hypothetical protein